MIALREEIYLRVTINPEVNYLWNLYGDKKDTDKTDHIDLYFNRLIMSMVNDHQYSDKLKYAVLALLTIGS